MMGDAGSLQEFIGSAAKDKDQMKKKVKDLENIVENLVEATDARASKAEKILLTTERRAI